MTKQVGARMEYETGFCPLCGLLCVVGEKVLVDMGIEFTDDGRARNVIRSVTHANCKEQEQERTRRL